MRPLWVLAVAAVVLAGCQGQAVLQPHSSAPSPPSDLRGGAPAPGPTPAPNPGSPVACRLVPYPAPHQFAYSVHDCWEQFVAGRNGIVLGGTSPDDRQQGVLIVLLPERGVDGIYPTPARAGDVTVTLLRNALVCFTTASGTRGAFDLDALAFSTAQESTARCR